MIVQFVFNLFAMRDLNPKQQQLQLRLHDLGVSRNPTRSWSSLR